MKKLLLSILLLVTCSLTLIGCGRNNDVKLGKYITENEIIKQSYVVLGTNNEFFFSINPVLSYMPSGTFAIDGDKLTLHVTDDEEYIFKIADGKLIFEAGQVTEKFIEVGTEFIYEAE